ncbi:MAG: FtsI-like cell division protein [Candidatus Magnetoglobus multicellularis str. Araruama]|uniref:FtsI-like cell division protein n=1 Tax=Candidatus Magnetoglobus multicellularis str. Araruama TaxID=890399 RepID=A0A1V1P421_9BACT|nr:MAG: FtsI-like cell division protein [Candidatus Magnetoglobus multicellularis str. Araruama]
MYTEHNWRNYQKSLLGKKNKPRKKSRFIFWLMVPIILTIACSIIGFGSVTSNNSGIDFPFIEIPDLSSEKNSDEKPEAQKKPKRWSKEKVRELLAHKALINSRQNQFDISHNNSQYIVKTSIDMELQKYLLNTIERSYTRYLGIVVMDPKTGRILSMVGFDKTNATDNPCIEKRFPAASVFKIVTAAAAIEICGLGPDSKMAFNGGKYTLYKRQITDKTNRYTTRVSFKNSFAQSINPVFGKLGSLYLGKSALEDYARGFGFNQCINFELPVNKSTIHVKNERYHQAEIACGFNRDTLITPLHGALLVSSILNDGKIPEPTIVDKVVDQKGHIYYQSQTGILNQAVSSKTCKLLKQMMNATVRSGTAKKSFRGFRRDRILSRLNIGGKTGSLSNRKHDVRFDWFVGFAEQKNGSDPIVISTVVAHHKYIGTRASRYARSTIKHYFKMAHSDDLARR